MTLRYRWMTLPPLKLPPLPRLRRRVHSFADESACVFDILMLAAEAQRVINLRLAAIASGVTEKMNAALEAAGMLARGASTRSIISFYRARVQVNVRRLTRKPPLHRRAKQKLLSGFRAFRR